MQNVFVQPYPPNGAKLQVSSTRTANAVWTPDGRRLFFDAGPSSNRVVAVEVRPSAGSLVFGTPASTTVPGIGDFTPYNRNFDVMPDGSGLIAVVPIDAVNGRGIRRPEITVVLNWFDELKRHAFR